MTKTTKHIAILGITLLLLIVALIVVQLILPNKQTVKEPTVLPEIREELGETLYLNAPLAYANIKESQLEYIRVQNHQDGKPHCFGVIALSNGTFVLEYSKDGTTETLTPYLPAIVGEESNFDLTSLYAMETGSSFGQIYSLTYLCSALGTPIFSERIDLPENNEANKEQRDNMLRRYGFTKDKVTVVSFTYADATTKEEKAHIIQIGSRALDGNGFYFMVDGRNVIYYTSSNTYEYALRGFEDFVNGRLVAEGLDYDYNFEPSLTSDYKQWVNTVIKEEGKRVEKDTTVVTKGDYALPFTAGSDFTPDEYGYVVTTGDTFTFSADNLAGHTDAKRFMAMLVGKTVGSYSEPMYLTLINSLGSTSSGLITFGEASSIDYRYVITAVESVITATDEIRKTEALFDENGDPVSYNLVKVSYDLYIGGEKKNDASMHAVIDLSSSVLPAGFADEMRAKIATDGIGACSTPVELNISYSADNSVKTTESLFIDAIVAIYSHAGDPQMSVEKDSYVTIAYYEIIDGKKSEMRTIPIDLAAKDDSGRWDELRDKLVGKKIGGDLNIKLYERTYHYEVMSGFSEYRIHEIVQYVKSELVVAFRYVNKNDMDPFYGESVYKNTMDEYPGYEKFTLYGIDSTVCQSVINLLGGVGSENNATSSAGYTGQTVAVGLTPELMMEYGLYAYTIYFELPRGIYDPADFTPEVENNTSDGLADLSSYAWFDTLGFTLHISEEKDGYRYVGSEKYDLVAKVPAADFSFLDYSFDELWARNNFLFLDVNNVAEIEFDFNMTDYYGTYSFGVSRETWYIGVAEDGRGKASLKEFEGSVPTTRLYVNVTSSDDAMDTKYEQIKDQKNLDSLSVSTLYSELYNGGKDYYFSGITTYGVANYKSIFQRIYYTQYQDFVLSNEDIDLDAVYARGSLMTLKVKVFENDGTRRAGYYAYDFYYLDDSRVMITAYKTDDKGVTVTEKVSSFSISRYAFENIVLSVVGLLNGETLDDYDGYIDKK